MAESCKYIKLEGYVSHDGGETWEQTGIFKKGDLIEENSTDCGYEPEPPEPEPSEYYYEYFTIQALDNGDIIWSGKTVSYNINDGEWTTLSSNSPISVNAGDKVRFKGNCTPTGTNGIGNFSGSTASFNLYGNIHSLLYSDDFVGNDNLKGSHIFKQMFQTTKVVDASNLILPAKILLSNCYYEMFYSCDLLIKAPELPATTLAESCYYWMFIGCSSLLKAPFLPALYVPYPAYENMFSSCRSLNEVSVMTSTFNGFSGWLSSVSSTGTIYVNRAVAYKVEDVRGTYIPKDWEVKYLN